MSDFIYTVTAITKDGKDGRCFGFYFGLESAKHAVNINHCDMQECLYEYVVIEKQGEGIHIIAEQIQWYKWTGGNSLNDNPGEWMGCAAPTEEGFAYTINWAGIG
jgi:hypothetical protein